MRTLAISVTLAALCVGCGEDAPPATTTTAAALAQDFTESAANRAPIIESVRIEPAEPASGATLRAVVIARDPEGQTVTLAHHWFVDGAEQTANEPTFQLSDAAKGTEIRVSVSASDGLSASDAVDASVRVIDRVPTLIGAVLVPAGNVAPGDPVTARANAIDADADAVEFEYTWFVNGERSSENKSVLPTDGLKKGDTIYAEVRATDGSNWSDRERTPTVTVGSGHPEITSTPPGFRDDGAFQYQVVAVDPDGDKRLRYSLEKAPDGMAIDDVVGAVTWRPTHAKPGEYPVTVVVRDSTGLETKQSFAVTVQENTETVATPVGRNIRIRKPAETPAAPEEE
jgi:hypothetical protein